MRKSWIILLVIAFAMIALRAVLPGIARYFANTAINSLEHYSGEIEDVHLALWRGSVVLEKVLLNELGTESELPFVTIHRVQVQVDWQALLRGAVVAVVDLDGLKLNLVTKPGKDANPIDDQRLGLAEQLMSLNPISINRFTLRAGEIRYVDPYATPRIGVALTQINLLARNLRNVKDPAERLPADIKASAVVTGKGQLELEIHLDILEPIPNLDLDLKVEAVAVDQLNEFAHEYAGIDFEKGTISVYAEVAVADGRIDGYVKPVVLDIEIAGEHEEQRGFFEAVREDIAELAVALLNNDEVDQVATRVPIQGTVENREIGVWRTLFGLLQNAFVDALKRQIDHSIEFRDVVSQTDSD